MKLIILLLFFATIILKTPVPLPKCDIDTAKIAVPPRIFEEVTIDGIGKNIYFTRFLHNKPGIFMSEFARCYFNVFDLSYLLDTLGIFGFVAFIYFAYRAL
ncbi:hypothetical protein HY024_05220, partial [Candidatus Curtissbacteria bacterium]|nr:hypothetical protein [Candidatus Curtissbacteria bacterium]